MSNVEGGNNEKKKHVFLSTEEVELIRFLAEKAKLPTPTIHELTGIPLSNLGSFAKTHDIKFAGSGNVPARGKKGSLKRIEFARKIALIKQQHASGLEGIRKKYTTTS